MTDRAESQNSRPNSPQDCFDEAFESRISDTPSRTLIPNSRSFDGQSTATPSQIELQREIFFRAESIRLRPNHLIAETKTIVQGMYFLKDQTVYGKTVRLALRYRVGTQQLAGVVDMAVLARHVQQAPALIGESFTSPEPRSCFAVDLYIDRYTQRLTERSSILQSKTQSPVRFQITDGTRIVIR